MTSIAALGGAHEDTVGVLAVEVDEGFADQGVVCLGLKADELDKAAGKRLHAERRRHAQNARDLLRGGMLGVDDHIESDLAAQDRRISEVFRIAHAGDRVLCAKLFRHQAAMRFTSSFSETAMSRSASRTPASSRMLALAPLPSTHITSSMESTWSSTALSRSMTTRS